MFLVTHHKYQNRSLVTAFEMKMVAEISYPFLEAVPFLEYLKKFVLEFCSSYFMQINISLSDFHATR